MSKLRAVILAGGKARRMGGNKAFHPYASSTLIEATLKRIEPQVDEVFINIGSGSSEHAANFSQLGYKLIVDDPELNDLGPLTGVMSALTLASTLGDEAVITAPCDMPNLPLDMAERLVTGFKVNPKTDMVYFKGIRDYPLCALWNVRLRPSLETALMAAKPSGGISVMSFLQQQKCQYLDVSDDRAFININSADQI